VRWIEGFLSLSIVSLSLQGVFSCPRCLLRQTDLIGMYFDLGSKNGLGRVAIVCSSLVPMCTHPLTN
jgi:hypothetical protein